MNSNHSLRILSTLALLALGMTVPGALRVYADPAPARPLNSEEIRIINKDTAAHIGDQPDTEGPLATDLSPALKPDAILKATRKVADWELARDQQYFNGQWTYGALYTGYMALADATGDKKYSDAMLGMGQKLHWTMTHAGANASADDQCVGQTFMDLYLKLHDPAMMTPTRNTLDLVSLAPDNPSGSATKPIPWWWCDALYMAPSVWARVYKATGDTKYLDYLNKQWWACSNLLYDTKDHLYHRDVTYLTKTEANGKPMYWSRGNGWVLGGLARLIPLLPANYPDRPKYIAQFKEMAAKVITLQGSDGLWRSGLLDPDNYDLPENSGSAFFTYALTWGMNEGLLDRATYQPVVAKAWKGLLSHVYADGRLGCIQQTGAEPARFKPAATAVYGVGAFMLAGSELHRLALTAVKVAPKKATTKRSS